MEYLSLRSNSTVYNKLYLVWSFGWNSDCYKRGQTSRPVVGPEIQTSCNFKANLSLLPFGLCVLSFQQYDFGIAFWYYGVVS